MKKSEKLKSLTDARVYKLLTTIDQDPYQEEFWSVHKTYSTNTTCKWKKKELYRFQYRMYRTWKYNRKTKYK